MPRNCPICDDHELTPRENRGVEVNLCTGCGGVFLDEGEFDPLIAERFRGGAAEAFFHEEAAVPLGEPKSCPADGDPMLLVEFGQVELDWCPTCAGIWIDGDERTDFAQSRAEEEARAAPSEWTRCAGCGEDTLIRCCMKRMDHYWCEQCVVEGNYPGGHGPPVQVRIKEAALSMAEAESRLTSARNKAERRKRARKWVNKPMNRMNQAVPTHIFAEGITEAVEGAAYRLRKLFSRKKSKGSDDR